MTPLLLRPRITATCRSSGSAAAKAIPSPLSVQGGQRGLPFSPGVEAREYCMLSSVLVVLKMERASAFGGEEDWD